MPFKKTHPKNMSPELRALLPKRKSEEFDHQCALFEWARNPAVLASYPELHLLSSSLNGVALTKAQAGKAYAAGMLKGEHDIRLPIARGPYIGLTIEMKAGKGKPTSKQLEYGERMHAAGHKVYYFWDWIDARAAILLYLQMKKRPPL